ncbi:MAG: SRPBCC domain-containing protein [Bacteroidetes bacterium]|nr:SRPBCC domain-containing protein [Bacteroidota bacterium]
MKRIRTEVIINAPISKVWNCLMDFKSYPDWNPLVHINGEAKVGSRLKNHMFLEGQKEQVFKPKVLVVEKEKEFRWLGNLFVKGLFDGEHFFQLEKMGENQTKLIHGENFRGILVGLIMRMIGKETLAGFEAMNEALRKRVE